MYRAKVSVKIEFLAGSTLKFQLKGVLFSDTLYTRILRAVLDLSWKKHPVKHNHFSYIIDFTQVYARHCWRATKELISDLLLWVPRQCKRRLGYPVSTYIDQMLHVCLKIYQPEADETTIKI